MIERYCKLQESPRRSCNLYHLLVVGCPLVASHAVYVNLHDVNLMSSKHHHSINEVVASCRAFTYFLSMTSLLYDHIKHIIVDCATGNIVHQSYVPIPLYLCSSRQLCSLILTPGVVK